MNVDSSNDTVKSRGRPSRRARNQNGQFSSSSTSTTSTAPPSISASVTPPPNPINLDEIIFPTRNPHLLNDIQSERNTRTNKFPYELVDPTIEEKTFKDAFSEFHAHHQNCFKHRGHPIRELIHKKQYEIFDHINYRCTYCNQYLLPQNRKATRPVTVNGQVYNDAQIHEKISREARVRKTSVSKMYKSLEYSCGTRNIRNK
eukprot:529298_1